MLFEAGNCGKSLTFKNLPTRFKDEPDYAIPHVNNSLLRPFTQPHETSALGAPRLAESNRSLNRLMRDDYFQVIPDASDERSAGSVLARIYRDIGLAAVADALRVPTEGFEPEMIES